MGGVELSRTCVLVKVIFGRVHGDLLHFQEPPTLLLFSLLSSLKFHLQLLPLRVCTSVYTSKTSSSSWGAEELKLSNSSLLQTFPEKLCSAERARQAPNAKEWEKLHFGTQSFGSFPCLCLVTYLIILVFSSPWVKGITVVLKYFKEAVDGNDHCYYFCRSWLCQT